MVNYQNGKIYIIESNETDDVYVGSTCSTLEKRFGCHKSEYKRSLKGEKGIRYCSSIKITKYSDATIRLIELFPCNTRKELERKEGEITKITKNRVNLQIQGQTVAEYNIINKEKIRETHKKWRENNKEKIAVNMKKWKEVNKEQEKEKRRIREKIEVTCECCLTVKKTALKLHKTSKKHLTRMKLSIEDRQKLADKPFEMISKIVITCWCGEKITWACFSRHCKRKHKSK